MFLNLICFIFKNIKVTKLKCKQDISTLSKLSNVIAMYLSNYILNIAIKHFAHSLNQVISLQFIKILVLNKAKNI